MPRYNPTLPAEYGMNAERRLRLEDQARMLGVYQLPKESGRRRIFAQNTFENIAMHGHLMRRLADVRAAEHAAFQQREAARRELQLFANQIYPDLDSGRLDDLINWDRIRKRKV